MNTCLSGAVRIQEEKELFVRASLVAFQTSLSAKTIVSMIENGEIRGKQLGRNWKVWHEDYERLIDPNDTFGACRTYKAQNLDAQRAKQDLEQLLSEAA